MKNRDYEVDISSNKMTFNNLPYLEAQYKMDKEKVKAFDMINVICEKDLHNDDFYMLINNIMVASNSLIEENR
jgi:hypothetical protein